MRKTLIIFFNLLLILNSHSQTYSIKRSYFVTDYLEIKQDSFSFFHNTDCSITQYSLKGKIEFKEDTLVLNPNIHRDTLTFNVEKTRILDSSKCIIRIVDSLGNNLELFESWTNDSLKYCCIFKNGELILDSRPQYTKVWVNPFFYRDYLLELPIEKDIEFGYEIKYEIKEPQKYFLEFESETIFIKKRGKIIMLNNKSELTSFKMKKMVLTRKKKHRAESAKIERSNN